MKKLVTMTILKQCFGSGHTMSHAAAQENAL